MPIPFSCTTCGRQLRVKDELAGEQIYCPGCKSILTVPSGSAAFQPYSEPEPIPAKVEAQGGYAARAEEPKIPQAEKAELADSDEWVRPPQRPSPTRTQPQFGTTAAGIRGGLAMMVISVIWFVIGLALLNHFFIYPVILFFVGLIAFVKGIAGGLSQDQ